MSSNKRAIEDSFPIVKISRLAERMGSTNSPLLEIGKWFARRKSLVFRAILLGVLKSADGAKSGADVVAESLYRDHSDDVDTNGYTILDPFTGGGTTVVEALRLGCRVVGSELNPVAWFITKVATQPHDIEVLDAAFKALASRSVAWSGRSLEETLNEQYSTECPCCGGNAAIIYTFWVKSAICTVRTCRTQVPLFRDYIIAGKQPSIRYYGDTKCPRCHKVFDWEIDPAALIAEVSLMVDDTRNSAGVGRGARRWTFSHRESVECPWCAKSVRPVPSSAKPQRKKVPLSVLLCPACSSVWQYRGTLPSDVRCPACRSEYDPAQGTIPKKGWFLCPCGNPDRVIKSIASLPEDQVLSTMPYAIEGYCRSCTGRRAKTGSDDAVLFEGEPTATTRGSGAVDHACLLANNSGRFFKRMTASDLARYRDACDTWQRVSVDLPFPRQPVPRGEKTKTHLIGHHYRYWHQLFNPRQLLCLSTLLRAIQDEPGESAREALLCAFVGLLNNMSDLSSYRVGVRALRQVFARHDYHPKLRPCEGSVWGASVGMGSYIACWQNTRAGLAFAREPRDYGQASGDKSFHDPVRGAPILLCQSAATIRLDERCDHVVTDPPYGSNINYAELADYFYFWLREALKDSYSCFAPESGCPKREEIVVNRDRGKTLADFRRDLTEAFRVAGTYLKDDGLLVFTFHHAEITTWEALLRAVVDAGYVLMAAYPIHGDAEHSLHIAGQQAIAYDLVHVCRKRGANGATQSRSWAGIRQEIRRRAREEITLIEGGRYGNELSAADVNIVLIGKCLELYSRHYGAVVDHEGNPVPLRQALEEIRMMVDQLVSSDRPLPSELSDLDPESYVYLTCLCDRTEIKSDEVHKATRGILEPDALMDAGLIIKGRAKRGRTYEVKSPHERFADLAEKLMTPQPESTRDLFGNPPTEKTKGKVVFIDHIHFLIGLLEGSENLMPWLERWRGLAPQIRAACEYLAPRQPALAGSLQKIRELLDFGLFR